MLVHLAAEDHSHYMELYLWRCHWINECVAKNI